MMIDPVSTRWYVIHIGFNYLLKPVIEEVLYTSKFKSEIQHSEIIDLLLLLVRIVVHSKKQII